MYLSDVLLLLDISTLEKILRPARPRHIPPPCCGCKLGATLALATHISECVKVAQLSIVMVGGGVEDLVAHALEWAGRHAGGERACMRVHVGWGVEN